jgi:hypothetical protein
MQFCHHRKEGQQLVQFPYILHKKVSGMSAIFTLLCTFVILPFFLILLPIIALTLVVIYYSADPDLSIEKEGGDEGSPQ